MAKGNGNAGEVKTQDSRVTKPQTRSGF